MSFNGGCSAVSGQDGIKFAVDTHSERCSFNDAFRAHPHLRDHDHGHVLPMDACPGIG